jgi:outer membrane protein assembly factor BamB
VDGERVYAYFGSYGIAAYDLEGKPVWEVPLPRLQNPFGSGTSPVVAGELVLLNRQEPKDPFLVALDRRTGKTVWKHKYEIPVGRVGPPYASYSTPVVAGQQVLVHGPTALEAFDLSTGHRQWWVTIRSAAASTPILAGDTVYVATWTGTGEADQMTPLPDFAALLRHDADGSGTLSLEEMPADLAVFSRPDMPSVPGAAMFVKPMFPRIADKDGQLQKEEWEAFRARMTQAVTEHGLLAVKTGGTGDVTDTHVLWKEKTSIPEVPSPIVYQNHVYMVRNGGIISCLDAAGGTLRYRARIGAPGPYYASPVAANGRLFVASGEGVVTVLAAGDRLDVLARNDLGEDILASPALVDGTLYIRTASALSAFGQK